MEANTMPGHRLGQFYENFSSWRRALSRATPESQPGVFADAAADAAGCIERGLDKITAVDELVDMAASIGWDDADAVQKILSDALKVRSEPTAVDWDSLTDEYPDDDAGAQLQRLADATPSLLDDVVVPLYPEQTNKRKARGNGGDEQPNKQTIVLVQRSAAIVQNLIPPEYLVDTVLQRRFLYSLTGKTGSGKTAIALYITACVGLGRPIGDFEVAQGNVLYLAGENPDDVGYRWLAMSQQMDFNHDTIPVSFVMQRFKLSEGFASLTEQARAIGGFSLVTVDTSPAFFEGDQVNDNVQQGDHARMLRNLVNLPGGPCVLALCHPVKNAAPDNLIPLGAGSFLNEVDGNLTCAVEGSAVELHWQGKIRGADFPPVNFELASVGHERLVSNFGPFKTVVARHLSDAAREGMDKAVKGDALLVLGAIDADPRASQRDHAAHLGWITAAGKPHTGKVSRAIAKLKAAKLVTPDLDGITITQKGLKTLKTRLSDTSGTGPKTLNSKAGQSGTDLDISPSVP